MQFISIQKYYKISIICVSMFKLAMCHVTLTQLEIRKEKYVGGISIHVTIFHSCNIAIHKSHLPRRTNKLLTVQNIS